MHKKNFIIKTGIALIVAATVLLQPVTAQAKSDGEYGYTYNYDWWGDVQESPDLYTVCKVFTSSELGLDLKLKNPQGLFVYGTSIYVCDSGNNRIIELDRKSPEKLEVKRIIDSFSGGTGTNTLNNPTDVAVSEKGNIFIADQGNARVLKLDKDLNYIMEFTKPDDSTLDPALVFQPNKLAIDTAERVYCIAVGINKGLVKYENDGTFSGFVGAKKVTFKFADYISKSLGRNKQLL